MEREQGSTVAAADPSLAAWRRDAADIVLAATTLVHLPAVLLFMLGYGLPTTLTTNALIATGYAVMTLSAFARGWGYRVRLMAFFVAAYGVVAIANLVSFSGTYSRIGLVIHPILVLVLCGSAWARLAIAASIAILVAAPFVRLMPGVAETLLADPSDASWPTGRFWQQAAALTAFLVTAMVLLDRFHRFLLATLDAQRAAVVQSEHEMRERQRLERGIAAIGDEERRRLGRELHDGVCQQITAALLRCQALQRAVSRGTPLSAEEFGPLTALLTETIDDAHNVALGLYPLGTDPGALAPALRVLARRTEEMSGIRCQYVERGDVRVSDAVVAQHLYRIGQEALSNAARHSQASRITVGLEAGDGGLTLHVEDNGVGLPPDRRGVRMGLQSMDYRARLISGTLAVASAPGGGTRVTCRVPRPPAAPAAPGSTGVESWIAV
jgi:signal transduction histidine kinase